MLAISNSCGLNPASRLQFRHLNHFSDLVNHCCAFGCALLVLFNAPAEASPAQPIDSHPEFAAHAQKAYETAKAKLESNTNDADALVQFGRTCYDWADFAASSHLRAEIADEGIVACRQLIALNSNSIPGHFYLAMNLGQLAQTKKISALKLVSEMEIEFKIVLAADPNYDRGGADRGLGLLYLQAPGWPTSIGSKTKAREHLQKAVSLAPDYPENLMNLIEAELKWGEKANVQRDMKSLDELWSSARQKFVGANWADSWADWDKRRDAVRRHIAVKSPDYAPKDE
jgi:tetratricopeptide (TPR) repeat protein